MKFRPSYGNGITVYWEYMGSRQRQCNDFLLIGDEDVHHAAGWTDNGGVEEDRLSWGLRRFLMTSTQTFSEVICSFVPVSFHGLMRKRTVYATRVNTAQKHDRLKHGTCLFWEGFFVRVWSVGPKRNVQRQRLYTCFSLLIPAVPGANTTRVRVSRPKLIYLTPIGAVVANGELFHWMQITTRTHEMIWLAS